MLYQYLNRFHFRFHFIAIKRFPREESYTLSFESKNLIRHNLNLSPQLLRNILLPNQSQLQHIAPEEHGTMLRVPQIIKLLIVRLFILSSGSSLCARERLSRLGLLGEGFATCVPISPLPSATN